jgi:hypothetical protein
VALSATTGDGVERLLATVGDRLRSLTSVVELVIPYERGDILARPTVPAKCWASRRARAACTSAGASTTLRSGVRRVRRSLSEVSVSGTGRLRCRRRIPTTGSPSW